MTEASPNTEEMKRYLFREMSEEESAAVEEKIFGETDFYHELKELENDLVDRYARGRLDGADRERFERSLKLLPKRREKTANAIALQSIIAEGKSAVPEPVEQNLWEKVRNFFTARFSLMQLAAGALALLLVCAAGFLIYKKQQQNEFAEIERLREAERIEKENRLRQLEEQKRLEEQRRIENGGDANRLPPNDNPQTNGNSLNENNNVNSEIEKLKKDIENLNQKKNIPSRNKNELQPPPPYLAVAISLISRDGEPGGAPKVELETVGGKQLIKVTKSLPNGKNYGSYEIVSNGDPIESKNIGEGAKSIVFYLSPETKEFEINVKDRARGGSEALGTYEVKLTRNDK